MSSIIIAILAVVLVIWYRQKHGKNGRKLPPGPRALPIIGNLHQIGTLPHRSLQKLSQKHGHIMSLWLGNVPAIVVSSPQAASLFLKTHGLKMADRPKIQAFEYLTYGTKGMAFSEYGPRWRNTRRICNLNLLSSSKIESFASLRKGEIGLLVQSLKKSAETSEVVDISSKINEVVGDISTMMILGKKKDDRYDLKGLVEEVLHLIGAFNLADYVPLLGKLDLQGLTRRMKKANKLIDQVVEKIITEYEQNTNKQNASDFIIALLSMMDKPTKPQNQNDHVYDRTSIKAILVELITAAYDTPAVSVEWTISELIRNPRVMKKLQDELQNVIGMGRMVEEKDLAKLDYLYMVVKESLRLHPVAPFPPRECTEDTTIEGYHIPKKSRIIVNVWAIGHDQNVWSENVEEFYPERFIEKNIDIRGNDFDLIPFGSGQRICAGMHLGLTTVRLVVAQLVHCFNLELPSGMKPDDIDMTESFGLALPRANHLLLRLAYRLFG